MTATNYPAQWTNTRTLTQVQGCLEIWTLIQRMTFVLNSCRTWRRPIVTVSGSTSLNSASGGTTPVSLVETKQWKELFAVCVTVVPICNQISLLCKGENVKQKKDSGNQRRRPPVYHRFWSLCAALPTVYGSFAWPDVRSSPIGFVSPKKQCSRQLRVGVPDILMRHLWWGHHQVAYCVG